MRVYDKGSIFELKRVINNSYAHDAVIDSITYRFDEDKLEIILLNSFCDQKIRLVFQNTDIVFAKKDFQFGRHDTVLSLTVEEDFSYLQNDLPQYNTHNRDDLYLLFQMFSGDEIHIVARELIVDISSMTFKDNMDNKPEVNSDFEDQSSDLTGTIWGDKELTPEPKENVLPHFEENREFKCLGEEDSAFVRKRKKVYIYPWKSGDVYAYPMTGPASQGTEFYGRYAICIKIDNYPYSMEDYDLSPVHMLPVVWIKLTKDNRLPKTEEEVNALEFVQQFHYAHIPERFDRESFIRMRLLHGEEIPGEEKLRKIEERFNKECAEKFDRGLDDLTDKDHNLHYYRVYLPDGFNRSISNKLIYLGNYEVQPPPLEYPFVLNIGRQWGSFEENLIARYRENKAYNESVGWPEDYL